MPPLYLRPLRHSHPLQNCPREDCLQRRKYPHQEPFQGLKECLSFQGQGALSRLILFQGLLQQKSYRLNLIVWQRVVPLTCTTIGYYPFSMVERVSPFLTLWTMKLSRS